MVEVVVGAAEDVGVVLLLLGAAEDGATEVVEVDEGAAELEVTTAAVDVSAAEEGAAED